VLPGGATRRFTATVADSLRLLRAALDIMEGLDPDRYPAEMAWPRTGTP